MSWKRDGRFLDYISQCDSVPFINLQTSINCDISMYKWKISINYFKLSTIISK